MTRIMRMAFLALTLAAAFIANGHAATHTAASCSTSAVQAAISAATDGDTVVIPNGSCAWSGGISTTKQIVIRAQSYTPTPGGNATRTVVITNNSASPLLQFTTGSSFHVGLVGIRFNEGSGNANHVRFNGSGSKVPLVADCYFEIKDRGGNNPDATAIAWLSQGGVAWNNYFLGIEPMPGAMGASILINSPRAWTTASTMGSLDTNGTVNVYFEDSTLVNIGQAPDIDDNGRFVMRYSLLDGAWGITHGFTSAWGGRHFEYYNNTFSVTNPNRNMASRYFWIRAGTGIFTNNVVNSAVNPSEWGNPVQTDIGDNTSPGSYPMPRQPGFGHNGTSNVSDPIYIWNNTGARAFTYSFQGSWGNIVQLNRDLFVNSGPKPGYAPYTYPHPMRNVIDGGTGVVETAPPAPTALQVR